jgi:PhzF family phenazine biosynthesis protein
VSAGEVHLMSVFSFNGSGGNPTAVVLDAKGMDTQEMLNIAQQYGVESSFAIKLGNDAEADYQFRYFVPKHEMEMCGHATIGLIWKLKKSGGIDRASTRIKTMSGIVEGYVGFDDRGEVLVSITQPAGKSEDLNDTAVRNSILSVLGISGADLMALPIQNACTSRVKTLVPIKTEQALNQMEPDFSRIRWLCDEIDSTGIYPYTVISAEEHRFEARQFPRDSGYPEDAATGIAATALAGCLYRNGMIVNDEKPITIMQGRKMGRLSAITVNLILDEGQKRVSRCLLSGQIVGINERDLL